MGKNIEEMIEAGTGNASLDENAAPADTGDNPVSAVDKAAGHENEVPEELNPGSGGAYVLVDGKRIKVKE